MRCKKLCKPRRKVYVICEKVSCSDSYSNKRIERKNSIWDEFEILSGSPCETLLIEILKQAFDDYVKCLSRGGMYEDCNIGSPSNPIYESCAHIIKDITKNPLFEIFDLDWEYIFKEVDKQRNGYFIYFYGSDWVHVWDFVYDTSNHVVPERLTR